MTKLRAVRARSIGPPARRHPDHVKKGMIDLPQRPGLGFDFDARALERYAMTPWAELNLSASRAA